MTNLLKALAAELERPRAITPQVIKHIVGTHGVAREDIGAFLTEELPKLEDYEVDLILAPLFTPSLADQAVFAELLCKTSIVTSEWPSLIQQLAQRPTCARLATEDGTTHTVPLRDVTVERFTHRLRLEGAVADDVFRAEDAIALLKLAETYEPANLAELRARIPHWQRVLQQDINAGGAKPFFNERVEELHGGGRDQRRQDNSRTTAKENEQAFLERLQRVLT